MAKKIRELISKPSEALEAMVEGLLKAEKRKTFEIDMSTYAAVDSRTKICFGCAATCTIQTLYKKSMRFKPIMETQGDKETGKFLGYADLHHKFRALFFECDSIDLHEFEYAMEEARQGLLSELFAYFGTYVSDENALIIYREWSLDTPDWKEQIPEVRETINELKEAGY